MLLLPVLLLLSILMTKPDSDLGLSFSAGWDLYGERSLGSYIEYYRDQDGLQGAVLLSFGPH